jgi:hypothetical protein
MCDPVPLLGSNVWCCATAGKQCVVMCGPVLLLRSNVWSYANAEKLPQCRNLRSPLPSQEHTVCVVPLSRWSCAFPFFGAADRFDAAVATTHRQWQVVFAAVVSVLCFVSYAFSVKCVSISWKDL